MARIYLTDTTFKYSSSNPYTSSGNYDSSWVLIKVVTDKDNENISGNLGNNLYVVLLSKSFEGWQLRLMDFIQYQSHYDFKNIIVSIEKEDYKEAQRAYIGHSNTDRFLRSYEPKILVHSTPINSWYKIKASGMLKSWNNAKKDGYIDEEVPIGKALNDPDDFSEYVMLGGMGYQNEIVVLSKQLGKLCYDKNSEYSPGARIYLDAMKIAHDGLLVRDGIHLKVKGKLELEPYVINVVTSDCFKNYRGAWTPFTFSNHADKFVLEQI